MDQVILLNADYSFLGNVGWQKAVCLMVKGKTEVLKYSERIIKNFDGSVVMRIPLVLKLVKFIRTLYRTAVPFSKRNVLIRDKFQCVYCGEKFKKKTKKLTIDHIVPKSKGGKSTFENCCASCKPCNLKKGNRLCREANMFPKVKITQPTINQFLLLKMKELGINSILKELEIY